jgi:hypothetical protein
MKFRLAIALCLTALPALTEAAWADNREQVMLRLPRCSTIADNRQYLDCYYAAIQPMRAELGLASAPQEATYAPIFAGGAAPAAGTLTPQAAATREEVMLRLTRCASIGDTRQYLDGYYAAAQPLRAAMGLQPAPQAATYAPLFSLTQALPPAQRMGATAMVDNRPNLVPQTAYSGSVNVLAQRLRQQAGGDGPTRLPIIGDLVGIKTTKVAPDQFGLRTARAVPNGVDHIVQRIRKVEFVKATGDFTVTLENGQVWRQVPNDDARARWYKDMSGTLATVAYGAGDTYNFSIGDKTVYKVRRIS